MLKQLGHKLQSKHSNQRPPPIHIIISKWKNPDYLFLCPEGDPDHSQN